ncbi:DUF58 domain-containing protein [Kroppenstedtia sanguinis]|uniref:DUF58 domain-containing protein n=1 Tax=Kroppenstedtia sanguinis TaxID=1380684 RepID=A0ABW4C7R4_9BACL
MTTSSKRSRVRLWFRDNAWVPTPRLLGWTAVGAAITLVAFLWDSTGWTPLACLGIGLIFSIVDLYSLYQFGKVELKRSHPAFFEIDEENRVELRVRHQAPYPVRCILRDDFPQGFQVSRREMELRLSPGQRVQAEYTIRPHRRGIHRFGRIHARVSGRLGLWMRQQSVEGGEEIRVYPRLQEVRRVRGGVYKKQLSTKGPYARQGPGRGSDFSHIREYVPDDEPRQINWMATARRGKLATNVYQPEQGQHVAVLIDCGRVMGVKDGELTRLDRAVEAVLAFVAIALERGDQVSLLAFSNRILRWVPPGKGHSHLQRLVEACFDLEPEFVESGYRMAVETLGFRQKRRALVALFTDAGHLTFADELTEQLAVLQRRHLVMTVTIRDPLLDRERNLLPREVGEVYRKSVAEEVQAERTDRMNLLKRRGTVVLDVRPGQLATSVIHQYIEIKNRALL